MAKSRGLSMTAAELIDAAVSGKVLVYGSLPPAGRDLDLLVQESQRSEIEARLPQAGFVRRGDLFARFADCTTEIVELCDAERWALGGPELDALFEQALPIASLRWLVRPAPHHGLLILARRLVGEQGALSEKLRARATQAVDEDPQAWQRARACAQRWSAQHSLEALEHAYTTRERAPRRLCAEARRDWQATHALHLRRTAASQKPKPRSARLTPAGLRHAARRRAGVVISFSGVDGSGKSFQAAALRDVLERLGHEAVVVRTRISWEDWLWALVPKVKRVIEPFARALLAVQTLGARGRGRGNDLREGAGDGDAGSDASRADDPVGSLRKRSPLLTDAWIVAITLTNAWSQWRLMGRHLLSGRVVICDRYTLDSIVEMRYRYGMERPQTALRTTLAWLYRRPARSYFLDVTPQTAFHRKGEWGTAWLSDHRALYLEECAAMGVELLDGERSPEQICAEVARDVWLNAIPH